MTHLLGPTGQLILQTLGFIAVVLCLVLLVAALFIESLQRHHRMLTPKLFYILFAVCIALIIADLMFTTHHVRPGG